MIEVKNLTKKYGLNTAVDNLSFTIEKGKIYGFLGPNGAGKSTTMNIITGCLAATEGQVIINGYDIFEEPKEAKRFIGYLPELPPLYTDMRPYEYLEFVGRAKGLKGAELKSQIDYVMDLTQIVHVQNRLIKNLSKGYRQRVGIAQAILGDPDIIILDEPTVGLDPQQIIYIRSLIKKLGEKHTVIISSHILPEVEAVCDHVMIISHGHLVANDTLENLSNYLVGNTTIDISVRGDSQKLENALRKIDGISELDFSESADDAGVWNVKISVTNGADIRDALSDTLIKLGFPIYRINTEVITLEDVFLRLTSENDDGNKNGLTINENFVTEIVEELAESAPDGEESEEEAEEEENKVSSDNEEESSASDKKDDGDDYKSLFS